MRTFQSAHIPLPRALDLTSALKAQFIDVEIGAGQGLHAIRYAAAHPERHLIAIERTHNRFRQLSRRQQKHQLPNLFPLHADALSVFVHGVPDASVDRIFLLYPNPYPKTKQSNLRWHNMPFMSVLKAKLKVGGQITLATNIDAYAREAELQMIGQWRFEMLNKDKIIDQVARSHFEKKYLARGQTCWNLLFAKGAER